VAEYDRIGGVSTDSGPMSEHDRFEVAGPVTLAEVLRLVLGAHPGPDFARTIAVCSVLVGDRPASTERPGDVVVEPGASVEFLPPFAGG
jgi:hypothetical protein